MKMQANPETRSTTATRRADQRLRDRYIHKNNGRPYEKGVKMFSRINPRVHRAL